MIFEFYLWKEQVYEFVPASDLGVWVVLAQGRAVVTRVAEASVAAEDGKVKTIQNIVSVNTLISGWGWWRDYAHKRNKPNRRDKHWQNAEPDQQGKEETHLNDSHKMLQCQIRAALSSNCPAPQVSWPRCWRDLQVSQLFLDNKTIIKDL